MSAKPLPDAAAELGVQPRTLARWLRRGAPAVRRGRRGRGGGALVDVDAVRAWRLSGAATEHADLEVLAAEVPELVAAAVLEAFRAVDGPHKRACAGVLAATWYAVACTLLDRLRRDVPHVADPADLPPQIVTLRAICVGSRRTGLTD